MTKPGRKRMFRQILVAGVTGGLIAFVLSAMICRAPDASTRSAHESLIRGEGVPPRMIQPREW